MSDSDHDQQPNNVSKVRIRVRHEGPLVVDGPIELVDAEGNLIPCPPSAKGNVALCRCGASANKPFCDGSHRT